MSKLFVALDLPAAVTAELALIQPPRVAGVRLAAVDQMHLTLHFLGKADVGRIAAALEGVAIPAFSVAVEGVGRFCASDGAVNLWAGVEPGTELLRLHEAVAAALAAEWFQPEARAYTPHITLARCGPEVAAKVIDDFIARNRRFSLPPVPVAGFGLYSSQFVQDTPVYHRERLFPLTGAQPPGGAG